jgi:hypothetical protein
MTAPPVTAGYLRSEGLGEAFIKYMKRWEGFVSLPHTIKAIVA